MVFSGNDERDGAAIHARRRPVCHSPIQPFVPPFMIVYLICVVVAGPARVQMGGKFVQAGSRVQ